MPEIRLTLTLDADAAKILTDLTGALRAAHPNCEACAKTVSDLFSTWTQSLARPDGHDPEPEPSPDPASAPMPAADEAPPFPEQPAPEPVPEEPARTVTEEDLRDVALRLIRARRREEVAEVVHRYADRISSITDPRDRAACYDALKALEAA